MSRKKKKGLCLAANSSACDYRQQLHSGPQLTIPLPPLTCVDGESQAVLNLGSPGASKHRQSPDEPGALPKGSKKGHLEESIDAANGRIYLLLPVQNADLATRGRYPHKPRRISRQVLCVPCKH